MLTRSTLALDDAVELLRAAGEHTRLRLLALLSDSDLTVTDLIEILGQSQPRISRHLRLLGEAGLLERYQEGAWAYFRAVDDGVAAGIISDVLASMDKADPQLARDRERLDAVRRKRSEQAAGYFARNAGAWGQLRSLHVEESRVETAMLELVGRKPIQAMLDLGTGTGRLLELFAPIYARATGVDASREMLAVARANLDAAGLSRVQVRQGDIYLLPTPANHFDLVTLHQVLHFLDDPAAAIREAARALAPGGRLLIADFAPHELDFLRDEHQHRRLGFSHEQVSGWLRDCDLDVEKIVDLAPEAGGKLTVTLWLARDRRMLMAGNTGERA
ncbi:MAG: metalloregulator ArsR/SmtB family transcription factor [Nitratireductor sp.]|nr:metalloregulator ArsR/SmtB family transcription factor [Nitratireductor sp.]